MSLDDPRWGELEGGYRGALYDASAALKRLEAVNDIESTKKVYQELWDNLHHQGDVGLASYYAVPHLVRIAQEKKLVDYNVLGLVSLIEIQRHKENPPLLKALYAMYRDAVWNLSALVT